MPDKIFGMVQHIFLARSVKGNATPRPAAGGRPASAQLGVTLPLSELPRKTKHRLLCRRKTWKNQLALPRRGQPAAAQAEVNVFQLVRGRPEVSEICKFPTVFRKFTNSQRFRKFPNSRLRGFGNPQISKGFGICEFSEVSEI